jgi:hypothetical protein
MKKNHLLLLLLLSGLILFLASRQHALLEPEQNSDFPAVQKEQDKNPQPAPAIQERNTSVLHTPLGEISEQRTVLTKKQAYSKYIREHFLLREKSADGNIGTAEEDENRHGESPAQAWEQDFIRTMDPDLKRPTPEVLTDVVKKNIQASLLTKKMDGIPGTSTSAWTERGPNNVGGRTRALVWDPNDAAGKKVWAGGVLGGLWYNNDITDASSGWVKVDDFWANLSITCMAFDPVNSQIAYVGTGEWIGGASGLYSGSHLGAGIWKTTNGGANWTQLSNTSSFIAITSIAVRNESGTGVVYAGVDGLYNNGSFFGSANAGLQRSADGGTSWTQVLPKISGSTVNPVAASISIGADNRIWIGSKVNPYAASNRGGGRVYYSDNGVSWTASDIVSVSNDYGRVTVAAAPSDASVVYSFVENNNQLYALRKTVNGGASWTSISKPTDADLDLPASDITRGQAGYDQIITVDPNDAGTVLMGAINIYRSTDGGSTWKQITKWSNNANMNTLSCSIVHSDQHAISFKPGSSSTVIFGNDGGVYYTASLATAATGNVIAKRNTNYNVTQFYSAAMSPTAGSSQFLAGAQDNGTQLFSNTGMNATTEASGGDGMFCFIDQTNPNVWVVSYVRNVFYYTRNGGATTGTLINDDKSGSFVNPSAYDHNLNILYTYKSIGSLYRVKNVESGTPALSTINISTLTENATAFRVSPYSTNSTTLFVGTSAGALLKITDADTNPTSFNDIGTALPAGAISCIEIGASEDELLVTFFNYGIKRIWYTSNGGVTWVDKSGNFPNIPARWALFNPNLRANEVILATELGMYGTTNFSNASPNWVQVNNGFANVRTDMLQIRNSDNLVIAATHGRGLFSSSGFTAIGAPGAPTITGITPSSATTGGSVSITGTNFSGVTAVTLGGTAAASFTVLSSTNLVAVVGSGNSGSINVSTGSGTASFDGFTYIQGPPTISSFTPSSAGLGTTVTINGGNLSGTSSVIFGNITATAVTVVSNTQITASVGSGASGRISLVAPGGTTSVSGFTFVPAPTIASFTPLSAVSSGVLTITGTNLSGTLTVTFGGISAASFSVLSSTAVRAVLGYGSSGDVSLSTVGGTATATGFTFVLGPAPTISSLAPASGAIGTMVTITGTNFNTQNDNNIVFFGPVRATVLSSSANSITVTVPPGAGYQPVSVLNKTSGQTAYSANPFMVTFSYKSTFNPGDFFEKMEYATGNSPAGVAIADMDGDGKPDIIVSNANDNTVSILRNTIAAGALSSTSFAARVNFSTGTRPGALAIRDIDGDGKPDIAVAASSSNGFSVLRNTSSSGSINSSSMATYVSYNTGMLGIRSVAIADLDADGKPEIIASNPSASYLSVFKNAGTPGTITTSSFQSIFNANMGSGPTSISVSDFDGDGKPDISFANSQTSVKYVSLLKNNNPTGTITLGNFQGQINYATTLSGQVGNIAGDLDGDGKPDIVAAANSDLSGNINLLQNNAASGSFTTTTFRSSVPLSTGAGNIPSQLAFGDIDGDGKVDILSINGPGNTISLFRNVSAAGVLTSTSFNKRDDIITSTNPSSFAVSDIDNDGRPDIVVANSNTNTITVYRNTPALPPSMSSFAPTVAGNGSIITITGTNLTNATQVSFGGTAAAAFQVLSSTQIRSTVASGSFSGIVSVTTPGGTVTASGFIFVPAPSVTSFSPAAAASGTTVTINGAEFTSTGATISFGGTAAASFTVLSSTSIAAVVGPGASGSVTVKHFGGTASLSGFNFCVTPVITVSGGLSACTGTAISLKTNGTSGIQWKLNGVAIAGAVSNTYAARTPGQYSVTLAGTGGCSITAAPITLTFNPLPAVPVITTTGAVTSFCPGASLPISSSTVSGNQWLKDGSSVSGANGAVFSATDAGSYTVTVTDSNSCKASSAPIVLSLLTGPMVPVISYSGATTFCDTGKLILNSNINTSNQWFRGNTLLTGATATSYTANQSGSYTVQVTGGNGCTSMSLPVVVTANPIPAKPVITILGADLISNASAGNQWYNSTGSLSGATSSTYRPSFSGYYRVQVSQNNCASVFSDPFYYLVTATLSIPNAISGTYQLLPNPANDMLFIRAPNTINPVRVNLLDANGKLLFNREFKGSILINVSSYPKGMYTVILMDPKNKTQESRQIIKL